MIQVIAGKKGSGKTKRLIDMTNSAAKDATHSIIFIDDDNRYMFDIDHKVRFINAADYHVHSAEMFIGFLCGMLSQNFDIGTVFVDAFLKLIKCELSEAQWFFEALEEQAEKHGVTFVLSVSDDADKLPDFVSKYVI